MHQSATCSYQGRCLSALAVLLAAASAPVAAQPGTFTPIPPPTGYDAIEVHDISGDGSAVVGNAISNPPFPGGPIVRTPFRWTAGAGVQLLSPLLFDDVATAAAVTYDGGVVVGASGAPAVQRAARWTSATADPLAGAPSSASGISASGDVVVGGGGGGAWRWTEAGGVQSLGLGYAADLSADGSVIAGDSAPGDGGWRWTEATGVQSLGPLPATWTTSFVSAVSADGSTIVGRLQRGFPVFESAAYTWTLEGGFSLLEPLVSGQQTFANDVSADGSVVVGLAFGGPPGDGAVVWIDGEVHLLSELLTSLGISTGGLSLTEARAVSDDGMTIAGTGLDAGGMAHAWVVTIPAPGGAGIAAAATLLITPRRRRRR